MYSVVSLFSGCGGMDLGFQGDFSFLSKKYKKNKFDIVWSNDFNQHACNVFKHNFNKKIVYGDILKIIKLKNKTPLHLKNIDCVIGGFPCQDFSLAGKREGLNVARGNLYKIFINVVSNLQPKIFIAENVKGLVFHNKGKTLKKIISDFKNLGYKIEWKLFHCADYGVPQNRERIIIVGTKNKKKFKFPEPKLKKEAWISSSEAIADLEDLSEGEMDTHFWSKAKKNKGQGNTVINKKKIAPTMRAEHHGNIEFHYSGKRRLSAREVARIQTFPDSFKFICSTSQAYRQIGNAVPPVFAWHIANSVQGYLCTT